MKWSFRTFRTSKVVAVRFGFAAFNLFDEYQSGLQFSSSEEIDSLGSYTLTTGANRLPDGSPYQTGLVYIDAVRLENGDIWKADRGSVAAQMMVIDGGYDLAKLNRYFDSSDRE